MSSDDDSPFPEWTRRRRSTPFDKDPFFGDIDRVFREMEKMMDEEVKNFTEKVPKDYVKERKLPDGSTKKGQKGLPQVKEEREPLVDVMETNNEIRVVVELPGVEKTDIKLHGTEDTLEIAVDTPQYKYGKEVKLPALVKVKDARSTYKNGVLEVVLPKVEVSKPKGEPINIG